MASLAAHPTPFAIAALRNLASQEQEESTDWPRAVADSCSRVLSLQEPFDKLRNAATALWADEAQPRLKRNLDLALRQAEA